MAPPRKTTTTSPVKLLTVREVAELDGTSDKTVRRAINSGLLEVMRIGPGGRLIRVHPAAHTAYRHATSRGY